MGSSSEQVGGSSEQVRATGGASRVRTLVRTEKHSKEFWVGDRRCDDSGEAVILIEAPHIAPYVIQLAQALRRVKLLGAGGVEAAGQERVQGRGGCRGGRLRGGGGFWAGGCGAGKGWGGVRVWGGGGFGAKEGAGGELRGG